MAAKIDGEFVVFLIGMRVNKWWKVNKWLPVFFSMPRMLAELEKDKSLGLLSTRGHFGFPNILLVQYWRSFDQLERYARNAEKEHLPAWQLFNKHISTNGDVGIWHETFLVKPGQYEAIYVNMPPYGLGKASELVEAKGVRKEARTRMREATAE